LKKTLIPENRKNYSIRIPKYGDIYLDSNLNDALTNGKALYSIQATQVTEVSSSTAKGKTKVYHPVRQGDVLGTIAETYHVSVSEIKAWNNLNSNTIRVGQKLQIYSTYTDPVKPKSPPVREIPDNNLYEVKSGDSLWLISRKFKGLSIEKIKELNNLKSNTIKPGQTLRLI
jgi:membrane-bound lytic murein transglycosylase D